MVIVRLILTLVTLVLVLSGGMYILTRDRRYLEFCLKVVRFTLFLIALLIVLFVLERYALVGWGVLL